MHGQGIDEPIQATSFKPQAAGKYYYCFDGLGSVTDLTDEAEAVVESYEYDTFGQLSILDATRSPLNASAVGNSYTYTGREYDAETGLYYYRARYYDASIGRFISADPIGFAGGVNFYGYAHNNPINQIDPFGNEAICAVSSVAIIAVTLVAIYLLITYSCLCPTSEYTEMTVVPRVYFEPPKRPPKLEGIGNRGRR